MRLILKEFRSFFRIGICIEIVFAIFISILLFHYNPKLSNEMYYDLEVHYIGYLFENWFFSSYLFLTPILGIIVGIEIMSKEIQQKTFTSLLIKPISRASLIAYKFLSGILIIICIFSIPNFFVYLYSIVNGISIPAKLIYSSILYA